MDANDKAILTDCLAHRNYSNGIVPTEGTWWMSGDNLLSVANILEQEGYLISASDAIIFFEKPWRWEGDMRKLAEEV